jgi:hypothetical protein
MTDTAHRQLDSIIMKVACALLGLACILIGWNLSTTFDNSRQLSTVVASLESGKDRDNSIEREMRERDQSLDRDCRERNETHERELITIRARVIQCEVDIAKINATIKHVQQP